MQTVYTFNDGYKFVEIDDEKQKNNERNALNLSDWVERYTKNLFLKDNNDNTILLMDYSESYGGVTSIWEKNYTLCSNKYIHYIIEFISNTSYRISPVIRRFPPEIIRDGLYEVFNGIFQRTPSKDKFNIPLNSENFCGKGCLDMSNNTYIQFDSSLEELKYMKISNCQHFKEMTKLKTVQNDVMIHNCLSFVSLRNLEFVGGNLVINNLPSLSNIQSIQYVGGDLYIIDSPKLLKLPDSLQVNGKIYVSKNMKKSMVIPVHLKNNLSYV